MITLVGLGALVSCKTPDVEVGSLGKKLFAPQLKSGSASPFDQDMETMNYVEIQGTCDSRIGDLYLSFDKMNWYVPPLTPNLTGVSGLPPETQNDVNCSDGSFRIYLTKSDLLSTWGIDSDDNNSDVDAMYIKGETLIGDTHILTLLNSNKNSDIPARVSVYKNWPTGFAGTDSCEALYLRVESSTGNGTSYNSALNVILGKWDGSAYTALLVYATREDCQNGTATLSSFSIPANKEQFEVYYKFPSLAGLTKIKVLNTSALTPNPSSLEVTVRDRDSNYRWLALDGLGSTIYKNTCYPFSLRSHKYDNTWAQDPVTLTVSSSNPLFKFYSDASCGTQSNVFSISGSSSEVSAYVKYSTADTSSNYAYTQISVAASGTSFMYDFLPQNLNIDISSLSSASKITLWGPRDLRSNSFDSCTSFRVVTTNSNGTWLPFSAAKTVNLATQETDIGGFYSDNSCLNEITSISVDSGAFQQWVYFKATTENSGRYRFNISATGLTAMNPEFNVVFVPTPVPTPAQLQFDMIELDFMTFPGTTSVSRVLTLTNVGQETAVGLAGAINSTPPFSLVGSTCGSTLVGGGSCTVTISADHSIDGSEAGTFEMSAMGLPTITVNLLVTGSGF